MDITLQEIVFYAAAVMMSFFSVLTVTTGRMLRSATYLLFVLFGTAAMYFILDIPSSEPYNLWCTPEVS